MNNTPDTVLATLAEDRAVIQRLRALVRHVESVADPVGAYWCPWCRKDSASPHANTCPAALEMGWPRSST